MVQSEPTRPRDHDVEQLALRGTAAEVFAAVPRELFRSVVALDIGLINGPASTRSASDHGGAGALAIAAA